MVEPDILTIAQTRFIQAGFGREKVVSLISELRREWRGETVYIHSVDREARDSAIAAAVTAGQSQSAIAGKVGCHVSTVRRVKSEWNL